jgi:hypothetical protein
MALLRAELSQVGLSEDQTSGTANDDVADPKHPVRLCFTCPWLDEPVELRLHYAWWPDGTESQLDRICVVYKGEVRGEIAVKKWLAGRLDRPLAQLVVDQVTECCAELTGKLPRGTKSD